MTILQSLFADVTFFEVCVALITVGSVEHALVRFAPDEWLVKFGIAA
jgi:hypothetical protein